MNFQFESLNYNIFKVDELTHDEKFYKDIIAVLKDNEVYNLPVYFYSIDTIEDAKDWFEFMQDEVDLLFIQGKFSLETIGFIFVHTNNSDETHLGYLLGEEYWNKGIISEVLIEFMDYVNETKQWQKLHAGVENGNNASIQLLEQLGFILKNEGSVYSLYEYQV
jgi:RimJ/RimL family protein N-acetyltransferase